MKNDNYESIISLLIEALRFYSIEENYNTLIINDMGNIARFALNQIKIIEDELVKYSDISIFIDDIEKEGEYTEEEILNKLKSFL